MNALKGKTPFITSASLSIDLAIALRAARDDAGILLPRGVGGAQALTNLGE